MIRPAAILAGCIALALPLAAGAEPNGALERIFGRVVRFDAQTGTVLVEHGALETAGRGIEPCVVGRGERVRLRRGEVIEALADTSRRPWRLTDIGVLRPHAVRAVPAARSDYVRIAARGPVGERL